LLHDLKTHNALGLSPGRRKSQQRLQTNMRSSPAEIACLLV
jgi:hypothetical protein